jgi:hypothetical protein
MTHQQDETQNGDPQQVDEPRGAGHLVRTTVPKSVRERRHHPSGPVDEVTEASEESFPASDPPGFAEGHAEPVGTEPTDEQTDRGQ